MISALLIAATLSGEPPDEPTANTPRRVQILAFQLTNCLPCRKAERDFRPWFERAPANDQGTKWVCSPIANSHIRLVDCECETELADKFKVGLCPTFVLTVDGREVQRWEGYPGRETLAKRYIEEAGKLK